MIFDAHIHIFPDRLAGKALENLSGICQSPYFANGTLSGTLDALKNWGIDGGICMHIATKPKQQTSVNNFAAEIQKGNLFCFGSVHPDAPDALEELQRIKELGLKGVKLHPDYQDFFVNDPKLFPIYDAASSLELPITFHTGWDPYSPDVVHAPPEEMAKVADEFPRLTIIAAHLGGLKRWDETEQYLAGKENVYFDTAMCSRYGTPEQTLRLIRKHGSSRVLFGSDCPWSKSSEERNFLESLPLTSGELEAILYRNVAELLQLF